MSSSKRQDRESRAEKINRKRKVAIRQVRPDLESLEDRKLLAIIPVTSGVAADLVSAINTANTNGDASNTIQLSGTYDLTAADNYWYGPDGLPAITSNLTIDGNPTSGAVIERSTADGTPNFRLFFVSGGESGLTAGSLTLHDVTLGACPGIPIQVRP